MTHISLSSHYLKQHRYIDNRAQLSKLEIPSFTRNLNKNTNIFFHGNASKLPSVKCRLYRVQYGPEYSGLIGTIHTCNDEHNASIVSTLIQWLMKLTRLICYTLCIMEGINIIKTWLIWPILSRQHLKCILFTGSPLIWFKFNWSLFIKIQPEVELFTSFIRYDEQLFKW